MANSSERRRSRKQLPPRPGQGGQVWHLLNDPATRFTDLGHGYYQSRTDTDRKLKNHIRQIQALGFSVALTRAA